MSCRLLLTTVFAVLVAAPSGGQAPPAGQAADEGLPRGGIEADYERVREESWVDTATLTTPGLAADVVPTPLKGLVPPELTLREGVATKVMGQTLSAALFGAVSADAVPDPAEKWFLEYAVDYEGVRLSKGSSVFAILDAEGQVLYLRKRNLPESVDATSATVDQENAVARARDHAAEMSAGPLEATTPSLEIRVGESGVGQLAWAFELQSESLTDPKGRRYWVAATGDGELLAWESTVFHTHFGTVTGTLWQTTPLQATVSRPLGELRVTRSAPAGGEAITGDNGGYSFDTGSGTASISAGLSGRNIDVLNQAGAQMQRSKSGAPANPIALNFGASGEFETAQVSAFRWGNLAFEFARGILEPLPTKPYANLPTRVNIDSSCNAYWNGSSINFFRAGGACPNTAYSDVVLHEYGHGIDHWRGGILDGGYSEGFGDAVTILVTRQPCLGRDFQGAGSCLRSATDVDMWPPSPGEGVHSQGKRYAQFTWELLEGLQKTYSADESYRLASRITLAAAAGNPSSIPDAVRLCFLADDDDGDLANGSPHFQELAAAADSRDIPRPPDPGTAPGALQIDVSVDTAVCASGAVQCTLPGSGNTAQAASSSNHNPIRVFVLVQSDGVGVSGLSLSNFTFVNAFVPAGGGVAKLCPTTSCGPDNFGKANGLYTLFVDRGPAGNWKAGAYGATVSVTVTRGGRTSRGIALSPFSIP